MIKLSEFKAKLVQMVRPNRFLVRVSPPSVYKHGQNLELLVYLAQSAKIPEKNIGEVEMKYHGMSLKLPGDSTHDDLSISFFNHYGWEPRNFFEDWVELMQQLADDNHRTDAIAMIDDSTITVDQLGSSEGEVLASYTFYDVFPKSVQAIDLNMETTDQVQTFTVDFSYSHWIKD